MLLNGEHSSTAWQEQELSQVTACLSKLWRPLYFLEEKPISSDRYLFMSSSVFEEVDLRTAVMGIRFSTKNARPEYLVALPLTLLALLG